MSVVLSALPKITFAEKSAEIIEQEIVRRFEKAWKDSTGETLTLYPGDPRRLLLLTVAAELVQQRSLIDSTGKQNMLAFAMDEKLDALGALMDVARLGESASVTTLRFVFSTPLQAAYTIPAGARATADGKLYFATVDACDVPKGTTYADIAAKCLIPGIAGNGLLPGQIARLVDPLPWVESVANITISEGGADVEDNENLRERIQLAPESFSVAGPRDAYVSFARDATQLIVDVGVHSPTPGVVHIYPLLRGGEIPGTEILSMVYEKCNDEMVRPLTDRVFVLAPNEIRSYLDTTWYIDRVNATMAASINTTVEQAIDEWILWQRSKLGRDVNPSELVKMMMLAGAKRVEVPSPSFRVLEYNELAVVEKRSIVYGGLEDG